MKSKDIFLLFLIILFSLSLRLLFLDKPEGFWHNELVMYNQASGGSVIDIIKAAAVSDIHFPLYQIMLSFWMKITGTADYAIRLFSVLAGVLTVLFSFFAGREFKNAKAGLIFALLAALNSLYIFYSQEVKFYIFLALYASISLYCAGGILKKNKNIFYAGYIISNAFIAYTFTLGALYTAAQAAVMLFMIFKNKQENKHVLKKFIISNVILLLVLMPYIVFILLNIERYRSTARIFTSSLYTVFILLQNYFTPALIALYDNPKEYLPPVNIPALLFIYMPFAAAAAGIYKSIKSDRNNVFILLISVLFLLFEAVISLNSSFRMLTRYTIMALPPLLLIMSIGLSEMKPKARNLIIIYLLCANLFFLYISPMSAVRGYRNIGYKPAADVLNGNSINEKDSYIISLRRNDLNKYLPDFKGRRFSLMQDFIYMPYIVDYNIKYKNSHDKFINYVFNKGAEKEDFEKDFIERVIKPIGNDGRLFYIYDELYSAPAVKTENEYRSTPVMGAALSKMNNEALEICRNNLELKQKYRLKHFYIFVFEKKHAADRNTNTSI